MDFWSILSGGFPLEMIFCQYYFIQSHTLPFPSDRAKLAPSLIKPLISDGENKLPAKGDGQQGVELAVVGQKPKAEPATDERKPPSHDAPVRWGALAIFEGVIIPLIIVLIILVAL